MKERVKNKMKAKSYRDQQGGTKLYALVAIVALFLLGHAAWNYIPVAYQVESFKEQMHNTILQVLASPHGANEPLGEKLKKRMRVVANENSVPGNAVIEVSEAGNGLKARVRFTRQVDLLPFGLYKYQFQFDNTASDSN
jgi:hypothetical protein